MQRELTEFNGIHPTDVIELRGLYNKIVHFEVEHIIRDRSGRIVLLCSQPDQYRQFTIQPNRVKKVIPTIRWR